jgi:aminopeptidase
VTPLDPAAFAGLLVDYCLEVRAGQTVTVGSSTLAEPLLLELQRAILEREAWPLLRVELPDQALRFYAHARDRQLDEMPRVALLEAENADANVYVQAPQNTRALAGVDPARITRLSRARARVREAILRGRWCSTLWPTQALAQQAGMSLSEYSAFVARALFLHTADSVAAWGELHAFQDRLIERLTRASELRIEAPGTDLTLKVRGRTWINSNGRRNMPSGEVFTGPLEDSANGRVFFGVPSSPAGVDVAGVTLVFRDGVVVEASAERGEAYLRQALDTDDGSRRLGEIGIGTNYGIDRPTGTILFDEKIGGTVHLALGRSYPETGGTNISALHWDLVCDLRGGGRLTADSEVVQEGGRFA